MKINDKVFYIMLDDYYYCGKDESTPTVKGLGTGALTGVNSVPVFERDKSEAKVIYDVITLRSAVVEVIDALRYRDIFADEEIVELKILFEEDIQ